MCPHAGVWGAQTPLATCSSSRVRSSVPFAARSTFSVCVTPPGPAGKWARTAAATTRINFVQSQLIARRQQCPGPTFIFLKKTKRKLFFSWVHRVKCNPKAVYVSRKKAQFGTFTETRVHVSRWDWQVKEGGGSFSLYKVLTHRARGELVQINDAKMQIFCRRIFPVHTQREANMCIKFAKRIKFCDFSFAPKEKEKSSRSETLQLLVITCNTHVKRFYCSRLYCRFVQNCERTSSGREALKLPITTFLADSFVSGGRGFKKPTLSRSRLLRLPNPSAPPIRC